MTEESMAEPTPNPVCITAEDLPDPPTDGEFTDPAEPHPDEPGVDPEEAAPRRTLGDDLV
ncbi:MAG TPA: hypothetical protein VHF58_02690 [Solirubrobacterales bacterium]|nr:hypothetical protein [Solirubrobacterales bacterium]